MKDNKKLGVFTCESKRRVCGLFCHFSEITRQQKRLEALVTGLVSAKLALFLLICICLHLLVFLPGEIQSCYLAVTVR